MFLLLMLTGRRISGADNGERVWTVDNNLELQIDGLQVVSYEEDE